MNANVPGGRNLNLDGLAVIPRPIIVSLRKSKLSSQPIFDAGFLAFAYFRFE